VDECKPLVEGWDGVGARGSDGVKALVEAGAQGKGLHSSTFQLNLSRF